ncbi:MAG: hypothetical protein COU08_01695 [Candidatus Harrisonbacteria bacterium CG10_big_fil_rev_8_21_14_0_10_42_17]|uniref:Aminoglycoside phosphotransferase domain-containing protein n=1 Tax=Candidatus Harrisonbacteria bacterium CG10_big_fil_rev_8_21_14_0_10_42_17 TaxID=1974584 RepID=A0A2M6WIE5_9BACT|nr:MAG: hypothetical protein COU08_01695 [Candidatus Harrisonbacteria bacterium CG10_big_fil_rev_8_21_14_0_10_42_17]
MILPEWYHSSLTRRLEMGKGDNQLLDEVNEAIRRHFPNKSIADITQDRVGQTHLNCAVTFSDGEKVFYRTYNSEGPSGNQRDIYFGDPVSLGREIAIMKLLKQTKIPVPNVLARGEGAFGEYAIVSFMKGVYFAEYLAMRNHEPQVFLNALEKIGYTLASTRNVRFSRFGSIQDGGIVHGGHEHFEDRLRDILSRHARNPYIQAYFKDEEWEELELHIARKLAHQSREEVFSTPQLVIFDLHARNFFVHPDGPDEGDLRGVFDVELAQAAPPALEWACMNVALFPLYGMKFFRKAKDAFLKGYASGGGNATENPALEEASLLNHALSAVSIYHDKKDGIRDTWSDAFKRWSLEIACGEYNPAFVVNLTRCLTKIPNLD